MTPTKDRRRSHARVDIEDLIDLIGEEEIHRRLCDYQQVLQVLNGDRFTIRPRHERAADRLLDFLNVHGLHHELASHRCDKPALS